MGDIDNVNIRRLDGGLLLVFRGLLRRGQTTTVARDLGVSQSAVSHALTRLRDLFDDPLFIRRPHGLEPTRRALELAPRMDALIDLAGQTLQREGKFEPAHTQRRFGMVAPEFVTALVGAKLVQSFRKTAPNASFQVQFLTQVSPLDALRRGEIDAVIGRYPSVAPGLTSELFFEDRYCVVARRGHPKIQGKISEKAWRIAGHVFADTRMEEGSDLEPASVDIVFIAAVQRWLTALITVSASDSIATCPLRLAERLAETLRLQVIRAPFLQDRISVYLVRRAGKGDAGTDWFAAELRKAVK